MIVKKEAPNEIGFVYIDGFTGSTTRKNVRLDGDTWPEMVEAFTDFLRGCGYGIPYEKQFVLEGVFDNPYPSAPNDGPYDDEDDEPDRQMQFDFQATEGWK